MVVINLLPDDHKREIRSARTNVILVRYIVIMLVAVGVLSGLLGASYVVLNTARENAETKVAENQQKVADFEGTRQQAEAFRADLATAKTVLDSNISFTKLIYKIASTIPSGVILNDLKLDPATLGSPTTITANARTFDDATKLKDSFTRNQDLYSNVQLQSIRSSESGSDPGGYPVQVTISLVINKGAVQ